MKGNQLREIIGYIVKEVLSEIDASVTTTSTDTGDVGLDPVMQQKLEREKKKAAREKLKADQKMLKKVRNDTRALKSTLDMNRRTTEPSLKKQIDAQKKAIATGL